MSRRSGVEVRAELDATQWGAWDELVDEAADGNPFLRRWWVTSAVEGRPRYFLVHDQAGELLGGLALERVWRGIGQLRMVGEHLGAADLDLVARPGHEHDVVEKIGHELAHRPGPVRFRLAGLRAGSLVAGLVPNGVRAPDGTATSESTHDSVADYLATRSANLRKDVGRIRRRIVDEGGEVILVAPADVPAALERFRELHLQTFPEGSTLLPNWDLFRRVVVAGVAADEVTLHAVRTPSGLAAVEVMLSRGPRLGLLAAAADRADARFVGAGNLLSLHAFEHAVEHDIRTVDFLRGASAYRARWVGDWRDLEAVTGHLGRTAEAVGHLPRLARMVKARLPK